MNKTIEEIIEQELEIHRTCGSLDDDDFSPVFFFDALWEYKDFLKDIRKAIKKAIKLSHTPNTEVQKEKEEAYNEGYLKGVENAGAEDMYQAGREDAVREYLENRKTYLVLSEFIKSYNRSPEYCYINYKWLEPTTKLTRKQIEPIINKLKEMKIIDYQKGMFTDDGEMFGSGWGIIDIEQAETYLSQTKGGKE